MQQAFDYLIERSKEIKQALKDSYPIIETDGDDYVWSKYRNHIISIANTALIKREDLWERFIGKIGDAENVIYDEIVTKAGLLWGSHRQLLAQVSPIDGSSENTILIIRQYPEFILEPDLQYDGWKIKCRWRAAFPSVKFKEWHMPDFELPF